LLAESTPAYTADGSDGTFAVELSAKQMRTGIEKEHGKGKTLEQMFDTEYVQPTSALAQAALRMTRTMRTGFQKVKNEIRTRNQGKIENRKAPREFFIRKAKPTGREDGVGRERTNLHRMAWTPGCGLVRTA